MHSKGSYLSGTFVTKYLKRLSMAAVVYRHHTEQEKDQPLFLDLAPNRGLPSQHLSMLLVRSYRTFAPLPKKRFYPSLGRYLSVALSSRSLALGVTQQVWSFGSPDFPQTDGDSTVRNCLR